MKKLQGLQRKYQNPFALITFRKDIYDQFVLSLTYHTNSIEGSTLTEQETAAVIFHDSALPDKSLVEQIEAKNHQTALQYIFRKIIKRGLKLDEELILKLHAILMNGIRDDAGLYRRHAVRIVGANVPTANYLRIPELMAGLIKKINNKVEEELFVICDESFLSYNRYVGDIFLRDFIKPLHRQWLHNSINGYADYCCGYLENKKLTGFGTLHLCQEQASIGLLAVDLRNRRHGVASKIIDHLKKKTI